MNEVLGPTLRVLNKLQEGGHIVDYAIGGAVGLLEYTEVFNTEDLDIFCHVPPVDAIIVSMQPLYEYLHTLGYEDDEDCILIEDIPVQFLVPAPNSLTEEALRQARIINIDSTPTRVFTYEHLLAIMAEVGRARDKFKLDTALRSREPDWNKLNEILDRFDLREKWEKIKP